MDKNTITGFVLIALVFIGFSYFNQPSQEEINQQRMQDSIALVKEQQSQKEQSIKDKQLAAEQLKSAQDTTTLFGMCKNGEAKTITLKNELVNIKINTKGGNIASAILNNYKNQKGEPVSLFNENTSKLNYTLALKAENVNTKDYYFDVVESTDSTAELEIKANDGSAIKLAYKLLPKTYMANLTITSTGLDKYFAPNQKYLMIDWQDSAMQQEKGYDFESRYATLTYKKADESSTDYLSETKSEEENIPELIDWIAYKNQFFSYVLISKDGFKNNTLKSDPLEKGTGFLKNYSSNMQTSFDPTGSKPTELQFYIGPNQYQLLQKMNNYSITSDELNLEELVYLGWPLIRWINRFFTIYIFNWFSQWGLSMGLVLLLITILLKIIVYPATKKSYVSSAKMRVLKPKLDELQKKYPNKEDSMLLQQEMMATYSKYGVSPMGGCLPMLIQMPIWIAMFNFVPNAIELRGEKFLWADDLSSYDSIIDFGTSLPLIGDHLSLFCVLFCATNLLYSWMNMKLQSASMASPQAAQQMKMMQWMMMLMPVFFFFVFNNYSSGLNYYYWISLLCGAINMWYLRWITDDKKLLAKLEENYQKNSNNPKKMQGLAARLETMRKMQEQQREMREKKGK